MREARVEVKVAETWQKLIEVKQEEGAEKAELHQLWKKMIQLHSTQNQDKKPEQLVCRRLASVQQHSTILQRTDENSQTQEYCPPLSCNQGPCSKKESEMDKAQGETQISTTLEENKV